MYILQTPTKFIFTMAILCASTLFAPISKAGIDICNYSGSPIKYAESLNFGLNLFSDRWDFSGWYDLPEGCKKIKGGTNVYAQVFVAINEEEFVWLEQLDNQ